MTSPHDILGTEFDCDCGRRHVITPNAIVCEDGAADRVPELAANETAGRRAVVLFDVRTRHVAGDRVAAALTREGWDVTAVLVEDRPDGGWPACDDQTRAELGERIPETDVLVPVGSGVLSDLGKWIAFDRKVPFVTFATAASMNGYTAANVAPTLAGVKSLLHALPARAVVGEPTVLAEAPFEMTASGLGDVLAKSVSSVDWRLNHILFGDYYCERSVGLVAAIEPLYLERPEALAERDPGATRALFDALMLTGVAMTMVGTSSPASGGEHLISHSLDMMSSIDGEPHDFHGRQVGVSTVMMAALYRRALDVVEPRWQDAPMQIDAAFWGPLGKEVETKHAAKRERLREARRLLANPDVWSRVRAELTPMLRSPEMLRDCLRSAKAAYRIEDLGLTRARFRAAFAHAHEIRSRFTILDLGYLLGLLPDAIDEILDEWGIWG